MSIIIKWTNVEGKRVFKDQWIVINESELLKVIGVLLLLGSYRSKNEPIVDLWSEKRGRKIFNLIISRNRFTNILRVLRFDDAERRRNQVKTDKFAPAREVFELWNSYLSEAYTPGWSLTIDEQLVNFYGKCSFKQYIPTKPGKYGLKIWAICDSETSYVLDCEPYTGKKEKREVRQGENVVKRLVKKFERSGRNITFDNFFTTLDVASYLLEKNLAMIGTIRKNKPELPLSFTNAKKREQYSSLFGFQKYCSLVSYCPRKGKVVTLISTLHLSVSVDNTVKKKP